MYTNDGLDKKAAEIMGHKIGGVCPDQGTAGLNWNFWNLTFSPSTRWDHAGILIEWVKEKINKLKLRPNEIPYKLLATDGRKAWWNMAPKDITEWFVEVFEGEE